MAWEISHSQEAWDNARRNLETWDREALTRALTDDAFQGQEEGGFDNGTVAAEVLRGLLEDAAHGDIVDMAMASIAVHSTCSTGGHDFWIDRQGFHTVPVDFTPEPGDWSAGER